MKLIEKSAILHIPKSNMAYCYDENTVHLLLRTKKDDLKEALVHHGDPFNWGKDMTISKMRKVRTTEIYDFWFVELFPKFKRLCYFFELIGVDGDKCLYNERMVYPFELFDKVKDENQFRFPWMNAEDITNVPDWVKDTIWYQIFPERFANGDPSINPENTLEWNSTAPTRTNFFGGDLQGIIDHLDHLVELGINGLYLCPIFKAKTNHKYDTIDYFEIDPNFGDKETFKKLVDECHKRGIKVMLDAVFNHFGYWHPFWQDVLENQEKSKYKDWFYINKFPVERMDESLTENTDLNLPYYTFAFTGFMPKVNTGNPEVRDYLLKVSEYWVKEFGIDAWRLDVANEVGHKFWREFRRIVNKEQKTFILGEIWNDSNAWLQGDQFDGVMNYVLTRSIIDCIGKRHISTQRFKDRINNYFVRYPMNVLPGMFNCLDSHDTARLLTVCKDNVDRFKLAFSILFTFNGAPSIYYGDEIGINGENDPDCRKCMTWDKSQWNMDIFNHMKKLCKIRKEHPVLGSYGYFEFSDVQADEHYLEYFKIGMYDKYLIMVNNADRELKLDHVKLKGCVDLLSDEVETSDVVTLKPLSMKVFRFKNED
ncbi:glycoside hydrolase family 13 protein [Mycoplasma cottewii]|uniref:Glycoside hydrolase family 13 protein n=1 Tax=Mycoplasma cottewii TaxID=51364 RepID=A0ABY5TW59_9MOLU|nr:glycoside hydrolase family 13 protein [Mycoplasma cottewii]UWD34894.1 glycoside hydrolase family 13 protein [Mycoplasma cottewii]